MNVLDANVLIALFRPDHIAHPAATTWFTESCADGESFTVPDIGWVGFTRIATHRRIFPVPATFEDAWAFVESVQQQPTYLRFAGSTRSLEQFAVLAGEVRAAGSILTDVYIAATARAIGGTVVTFDRDFRKFDGLRVKELKA